jgi:hypothetical protein
MLAVSAGRPPRGSNRQCRRSHPLRVAPNGCSRNDGAHTPQAGRRTQGKPPQWGHARIAPLGPATGLDRPARGRDGRHRRSRHTGDGVARRPDVPRTHDRDLRQPAAGLASPTRVPAVGGDPRPRPRGLRGAARHRCRTDGVGRPAGHRAAAVRGPSGRDDRGGDGLPGRVRRRTGAAGGDGAVARLGTARHAGRNAAVRGRRAGGQPRVPADLAVVPERRGEHGRRADAGDRIRPARRCSACSRAAPVSWPV